jgi:gamma-glutamyl hercynylcysteine S-oxide synthase
MPSHCEQKKILSDALHTVRERTLWLLEQVPEAYLKRRVHDFYSPIGWHFGHVAMTEEFWVCEQALGLSCRDEAVRFLFANLPENSKDNRVNLPSRAAIIQYMNQTRTRVLEALETADLDADNPLLANGYAWEFAIQHECQHQETIAELLTLIHQAVGGIKPMEEIEWRRGVVPELVAIPRGTFWMGSDDPAGYDNEKRSHEVTVKAFTLDKFPVTAYDWSEFIADGGYRRAELWTPEGWKWRQSENVERPEYWFDPRQAGRWVCWHPRGDRAIHPDEPAASLSWHEAQAYAKWAGRRLPTEAEWEYAARGTDGRRYPWGHEEPSTNYAAFGLRAWQPAPVGSHPAGASPFGVQDMAGSVWEWTASPFLSYPDFNAFPYDGYSLDHMDGNHRVCRGGSWATSPSILRCSFRNWYIPTYRQGFLGVRLAS